MAVALQTSKLRLFRGGGESNQYASSPFVTKIEFRLRLAGIPYSIDGGAPWLGPKGKIPYIELLADDGAGQVTDGSTLLGDSALIIKHLVEQHKLQDLNDDLAPADKARDLALRALLEDKLYFYHMRECWIDNYHAQRDQALSGVPFPVRVCVGQVVYRKVVRTLYGQGAGRYSSEEIQDFRTEIWNSYNDMLESLDKPENGEPFWCLGGDQPTEADITLFGFISSILTGTSCPGSSSLLRSLPAVMDYADRIHNKLFPEYVAWQKIRDVPEYGIFVNDLKS